MRQNWEGITEGRCEGKSGVPAVIQQQSRAVTGTDLCQNEKSKSAVDCQHGGALWSYSV